MSHATDSRFQRFTAPAATDDNPHAPDSEVYVRIGEGDKDDNVNTLNGVVPVNKGDAVVEKPDSPGTYDVIPADTWQGLDWSGGDDNGVTDATLPDDNDDNVGEDDYSSWSAQELGDEIDARNENRPDDAQLDKPRSNADRIRVLTDDDNNA